MTRKLFDWIGLRRRQPGRPAHRTAKPRQHRLAFEAIEPRLLLSVASGDVSEGGMVSFSGTFTFDGECCGVLAGRDILITTASGETTFLEGNGWDSLPDFSRDTSDAILTPQAETVVPNAPKNIGLDDEDFAPKTPETGTVDLSAVAYDRVFAEIGDVSEAPGLEAAIAAQREFGSTAETHEPSMSSQIEPGKEPSARRMLTGSRGRLAAFDLAIQELSATEWHRDVTDPNVRDAAAEMSSSKADPGPAESPRPTIEAFSENDREGGTPTPLAPDAAPAVTRVAFQPQSSSTSSGAEEAGPKEPVPADGPAGQAAASHSGETNANPTRGLAVQLDPPREKNPVHLVLLAGISQAMFRRYRQQTADSGYEQLPPRKR